MKRTSMFAMALTLALLATPAALAGNFYVGGAIGQTSTDINGVNVSGVNVDDSDTGYKLFGGYSFFRNFAVEAGYVDVGQASIETTVPIQSSSSAEADGFALEAVGVLPLGERFELFAKYGWYMWDATVSASIQGLGTVSASDDGTDPTYGIGFGWNVTERGRLQLELERYEIDTMDVDTYLVGYAFSF